MTWHYHAVCIGEGAWVRAALGQAAAVQHTLTQWSSSGAFVHPVRKHMGMETTGCIGGLNRHYLL